MSLDEYVPGTEARAEHTPSFDPAAHQAPPWGEAALPVGTGAVGVVLEGMAAERLPAFRERLGGLSPGAGDVPARWRKVQVRKATSPWFLVPRDRELYRISETSAAGRLQVWSYGFMAEWHDDPGRPSTLWLCNDDEEGMIRAVNNFLRACMARLALREGSMLIHGSCLVRGGRAFVFFGPSGSGKSTVVRLSPSDTVLADDMTLVTLGDRGLRASAAPLPDKSPRRLLSAQTWPVAGLFRLIQSPFDRAERLSRAQALAELNVAVPFLTGSDVQVAGALNLLARFVDASAVHRLHFTRSARFWETALGAAQQEDQHVR